MMHTIEYHKKMGQVILAHLLMGGDVRQFGRQESLPSNRAAGSLNRIIPDTLGQFRRSRFSRRPDLSLLVALQRAEVMPALERSRIGKRLLAQLTPHRKHRSKLCCSIHFVKLLSSTSIYSIPRRRSAGHSMVALAPANNILATSYASWMPLVAAKSV